MPLIARIALVFASGAVAGAFLPDNPAFLIALLCVAAGALACARGGESTLLVGLAAAGAALGLLHNAAARAQCSRIADGQLVAAVGVLHGTPTEAQRSIPVRMMTPGFCRGTLRVRVPENASALHAGDEVRIRGKWMTLRIGTASNTTSDGMLLATAIEHLPVARSHPLLRARGRAEQRIKELFPVGYPLAEALLVAQRDNLNPDVRAGFAAAGLTHLLAISGTHVALVAAALLLMARLLRCSRATAAIISLVGSAAYVFFLGAPYAALRALIQLGLLIASRALQRPAHPLGLLAAAALVIATLDPGAPLDAGFQLSFAGICGIVLWRRPLIDALPSSIPLAVRDAIATTCAATAITTPIAAAHFGTVSVISLVANLLAIPVVSLAVPTAAAALALSAVSMEAARFIAGGSELTLLWLNDIAQRSAAVPGGHFAATPAAVLVATVAALIALVAMRERQRSTLTGRAAFAALAGLLTLVAAPLLPMAGRNLQIHMIDVGQGDAFAIRSPRGRWVLVDAGPKSERFDAGARNVVPFLLRHQAGSLVAVILSHPHLDHFGGLPAIVERLRVGAILDPGMPVASPSFDAALAVAGERGIPWRAGRAGARILFDDVTIDFLGPDRVPVDALADPNDYSAAFRLSYGSFTALFLGDMSTEVEAELVRHYGDWLDIDLLKVAHHGSRRSSGADLLIAASPSVALVSAGRKNRYGHPHPLALNRLELSGARVFRTDRDGSVSVLVEKDGAMRVQVAQ